MGMNDGTQSVSQILYATLISASSFFFLPEADLCFLSKQLSHWMQFGSYSSFNEATYIYDRENTSSFGNHGV